MPQVKMKKTLQIARYEPLDFEITISGEDLPRWEGEDLKTQLARMQLEAYKQTLAFQVYHGHIKISQAALELRRFKDTYHLESKPFVNGVKIAS